MTDCLIVGYNNNVIVMLMVNERGGGGGGGVICNNQYPTCNNQWSMGSYYDITQKMVEGTMAHKLP